MVTLCIVLICKTKQCDFFENVGSLENIAQVDMIYLKSLGTYAP